MVAVDTIAAVMAITGLPQHSLVAQLDTAYLAHIMQILYIFLPLLFMHLPLCITHNRHQ
jgi:hypothetical protein